MDSDRFRTLADAYGGDLRRWPPAEREAGEAWRSAQPDAAKALLQAAGELDLVLDAWLPPPVPAALRERVLASASGERRSRGRFSLWLSGAALAAACAAGVAVGVVASSVAVSDVRADELLASMPDEAGAALAPYSVSELAAKPA